jgi:hypothetical protein
LPRTALELFPSRAQNGRICITLRVGDHCKLSQSPET